MRYYVWRILLHWMKKKRKGLNLWYMTSALLTGTLLPLLCPGMTFSEEHIIMFPFSKPLFLHEKEVVMNHTHDKDGQTIILMIKAHMLLVLQSKSATLPCNEEWLWIVSLLNLCGEVRENNHCFYGWLHFIIYHMYIYHIDMHERLNPIKPYKSRYFYKFFE